VIFEEFKDGNMELTLDAIFPICGSSRRSAFRTPGTRKEEKLLDAKQLASAGTFGGI